MDKTGTIFSPPGSSTIAGEVDALFYFMVYVSIIFLGIVTFGIIYFGLRYRWRAGDTVEATPDSSTIPEPPGH